MADLALLLQNAAIHGACPHPPAEPVSGSSGDSSAAIDAARAIAQSSLTNAKRTLSAGGRPAEGSTAEASAKRVHRSLNVQHRRIAPRLGSIGTV
eukprot:1315715-Heterocapsa_arctica.AAC.1